MLTSLFLLIVPSAASAIPRALVVQDVNPTDSCAFGGAVQSVLQEQGVPFDWIASSALKNVDLADYSMLFLPSCQEDATYQAWNAEFSKIDAWVQRGNFLAVHRGLCNWVATGSVFPMLPGGEPFQEYPNNNWPSYGWIPDPSHPLMSFVPTSYPYGDPLALEWFWDTGNVNDNVLMWEEQFAYQPIYFEREHGSGVVAAGTVLSECNLACGYCSYYGYGNHRDAGWVLVGEVTYGQTFCDDTDGDGDGWSICDGDCDDADATVSPGAVEVCDGIDNTCNGLIDEQDPNVQPPSWWPDADGDGYGAATAVPVQSCDAPVGYVGNNGDCNDTDATLNPLTFWYRDADGDGFGDPNVRVQQCTQPAGYVRNNQDCNDGNASIHPGAPEVCNGVDDNCNNLIDDADPGLVGAPSWWIDGDGDGYGDVATAPVQACLQPAGRSGNADDCDDTDAAIHPGAPEVCNGIDDNCNGLIDDADPSLDTTLAPAWWPDADGDGFGDMHAPVVAACAQPDGHVGNGDDCNDATPQIFPGANEVCNGIDDSCNGLVDDADPDLDTSTTFAWWPDSDGDGYGDPEGVPAQACAPPDGHVADATDCDDTNPDVHPAAPEVCNGIDDNCNGLIDDADPALDPTLAPTWWPDADGDGFGDPDGTSVVACEGPPGYVDNDDDCDDTDPDIYPGAPEPENDCPDEPDDTDTDTDTDTDGPGGDTGIDEPIDLNPPSNGKADQAPPSSPGRFGLGCATVPQPSWPWLGFALVPLLLRRRR